MLPGLRTSFDALRARRDSLLHELEGMSEAQRAFRPRADAWSAADVAQHLMLVERESLRAALARKRDGGPVRRGLRDALGVAAVRVYFALGLRVKTPIDTVRPLPSRSVDWVRAEWEETSRTLERYLDGITEATARFMVARHPVGGPFDAARALWFLAAHFDHHLRQVERIRRSPGFPGA